jgi:succinate dehydrogenase / fumarate reductase, membrane anchor subunit
MARMTTDARRVKGLGAARDGTGHFWVQRVTAVSNIPLIIFFIGLIAYLYGRPYAETRAVLGSPWVALPLLLALASVLNHMRIGMKVIIEDYIHGEGLKLALLMLNIFYPVLIGVLAVYAVIKISLGG